MKKLLLLIFLFFSVLILSSSIKFGMGWSFGNSYQILLGYSSDYLNFDWLFNPSDNYKHKIYVDAFFWKIENLSFYPMLFVYNAKNLSFTQFEGGIKLTFSQERFLISLSVTYPFNYEETSLSNLLHLSAKYIVPPPEPHKKWKDDLFLIINYDKQQLFLGIGLAEHF
ncbi:hypothetical protein SU69_07040 [Thermosipho melanesiensis]|uniref:Uncharacterized protein n=2 Tax=Thermosipho melanesiensis TaxID=46541 RepID=A6LMT6_THEM4|nr:hypothetical protein [Thermosipho melanesiensis]ABR31237.1 hypothetical protein Tmel_1390 [Thermosipho melanesiensis BI429]APT74321.1 hypothetical protein BW47_07365 [Thermosipho melanesiensis]OOC36262.1 hypothetical protein SU68_07110 [Thermosipho melanesiensis]OOC37080.1 hypothetical protein SU69_07040 [Thermosipho melanesiensis]OOC37832.1 hypothetical protein SU70_07050 [Thermosipho melanesiensis]